MEKNYIEPHLSDQLKCNKCNDFKFYFQMLPCEHSLCSYCINGNDSEIICPVCNIIHPIPLDGFPEFDQPRKRMKTEKKESSIKSIINEIELKLAQTESDINDHENVIKEHCLDLKRKVQLAKEELILGLETEAEKMIEIINQYQNDKLGNVNSFKLDKSQINCDIEAIKENLDISKIKWETYCKFNLDESGLKREFERLKEKVSEKQIELKHLHLGNEILEFSKNRNIEAISESDLTLVSKDTIDLDRIKTFDLARHFYKDIILNFDRIDWDFEYFNVSFDKVIFMENNNLIVKIDCVHEDRIFLFDNSFRLVKSVSKKAERMFTAKNKLCTYLFDLELEVLDENLDQIHVVNEESFDYNNFLIGFTGETFFIIDKSQSENLITEFNFSLQEIRKFGQTLESEKPFFIDSKLKYSLNEIYHFKMTQFNCFLFCYRNELHLVNELDGSVIIHLKDLQPYHDVFLDTAKNILKFIEGYELMEYDLKDCSLIRKTTLKTKNFSKFVFSNNGNICCYDNEGISFGMLQFDSF